MAIAQSFRFRLAKRVVGILPVERSASVAAQEANNVGLRWTFAPMVDIVRDPRWGRITEGAGEDPPQHLRERACVGFRVRTTARRTRYSRVRNTGSLTAMQKEVATTTPPISENTLREIYFPPFKAAVDAGVGTLMSLFNAINGVPASANAFTLTKVLRQEWKFDGFVVAIIRPSKSSSITASPETKNRQRRSRHAGVDMEMVSRSYNQFGPQLLKQNKTTQATIDEAVRKFCESSFVSVSLIALHRRSA